MGTLSVVVITLNEERNIAACLETVSWADEMIVLDSGSSDSTVSLASQYGARVATRPFTNYAQQKNAVLDMATCDWVLSLDADERLSAQLAAEIRQAIASPGDAVGFLLPRLDLMLGRWIHHGLWWPQHKLRLVRRGQGEWLGNVHEVLQVKGLVRRLHAPLLHYANDSISDIVRKMNRYTSMEAEAWHAAGIRPSLWKMLLYPPALFVYCFIVRFGWLDGMAGLTLALLMAYYTFIKRAKLWEMSTHRDKEAGEGV
jgi:glycosyltransferase involved in cell wall biosynthesis